MSSLTTIQTFLVTYSTRLNSDWCTGIYASHLEQPGSWQRWKMLKLTIKSVINNVSHPFPKRVKSKKPINLLFPLGMYLAFLSNALPAFISNVKFNHHALNVFIDLLYENFWLLTVVLGRDLMIGLEAFWLNHFSLVAFMHDIDVNIDKTCSSMQKMKMFEEVFDGWKVWWKLRDLK